MDVALHSNALQTMLASGAQEAKAAAKKVKAERAVARQQAAVAEAKPAGSSKKAKAKQEAEEKRVSYCLEQAVNKAELHTCSEWRLLCLCCVGRVCASLEQATRCMTCCSVCCAAANFCPSFVGSACLIGVCTRAGTGG